MKTAANLLHNKMKRLMLTAFVVFGFSTFLSAQTMTMAPPQWILNATGKALDVQAVISGPLASGAVFSGHSISLTINGTLVAMSSNLEYCWVDQNFLVSFDKTDVFQDPYVISLAGTGQVTVNVAGTYTYTLPDGSSHLANIPASWDYVTIIKPGKNMKNKP